MNRLRKIKPGHYAAETPEETGALLCEIAARVLNDDECLEYLANRYDLTDAEIADVRTLVD